MLKRIVGAALCVAPVARGCTTQAERNGCSAHGGCSWVCE
jgi:hypothetical protein